MNPTVTQPMKKPRPFNHRPIYINTRRDLLAEIELRAKKEFGLEPDISPLSEDLRGVFSRGRRHVSHRQKGWGGLSTQKLLLLIVLLLMIWKLLL